MLSSVDASTGAGTRVQKGVGIVLIFLALVMALGLPVAVMVGSAFAALFGRDDAFWSLSRISFLVALTLLPFALTYFGLVLLEGRRICVVYLRRFGLNVHVIGPKYRRGLNRNIRLITLDDGKFRPVQAPAIDVWFSRLMPAIVLGLVIVGGVVLIGRGPMSEGNDATRIGVLLAMMFTTGLAFFILTVFLLHGHRMQKESRILVNAPDDLAEVVAIARNTSAWWTRPALFGRQAMVISVSDELWQLAVQSVARNANAVLVDVSDRSAHVDWELNFLQAENIPHVLIAEQPEAFHGSAIKAGDDSARDLRNVSRSELEKVVGYDLANAPGLKTFRRRVAAELRGIALPMISATAWSGSKTGRRVVRVVGSYALILCVAAIVGIGAGLLSYQFYLPVLNRG